MRGQSGLSAATTVIWCGCWRSSPSVHSRQVIRTVLCCLQMDMPQMWHERVVLHSSWRVTPPIATALWWCQWWSIGKNATTMSAHLDASPFATMMSETFWGMVSGHLFDSCPAHAETSVITLQAITASVSRPTPECWGNNSCYIINYAGFHTAAIAEFQKMVGSVNN